MRKTIKLSLLSFCLLGPSCQKDYDNSKFKHTNLMQDLQNLSIKYSDSSYLVYTLYNKETPVDTTTSDPINPYDNIGKHHNTILVEYINQYHKTDLKGSQLDTLTNFITKRITELNPDLIVEENQYDAHQFINIYHNLIDTFATNFHLDYFLDLMNIKNYINIEEKEILALFLSTVQNLPLDCALHYTKDFEAVILTNTTLIHDSKEKILASLSVARNSLELYDKYRYL